VAGQGVSEDPHCRGRARAGEHVKLKARVHDVSRAGAGLCAGRFALRPAARGFVITADQPLQPGRWSEQGQPFFSKGVAFAVVRGGPAGGRYAVSLRVAGSVARVR